LDPAGTYQIWPYSMIIEDSRRIQHVGCIVWISFLLSRLKICCELIQELSVSTARDMRLNQLPNSSNHRMEPKSQEPCQILLVRAKDKINFKFFSSRAVLKYWFFKWAFELHPLSMDNPMAERKYLHLSSSRRIPKLKGSFFYPYNPLTYNAGL